MKNDYAIRYTSLSKLYAKIEHAVSQQPGVSNTKVLFNASKIKANFDPDKVHPEQLAAVVEKLGYEVQSTKVKEA